ncbi:S-adenosyl-L-methionine-dependent methyltransferase [Glonium stellatum]|uniref:S-adenosyl-L-methionine-dependent methyltransferase n=1 Tax=Glonium stellatum TaxID=574774 RepID=A0A8E2F9J7_9PEZI|nr:S-adenosyl-L-methionine-dependent methyltransferase [Glonium stellatum]
MATDDDGRGEAYETEYVHTVYEQIASHFSSTRYKPWPIVERFLKSLRDGSIGVDVGCGNGKYLSVNPNVFIIGSANLARIAARHEPHSSVVADNLSLPHPLASFDFAISIAVIHHLSTPLRRIQAVRAILELLKTASGGTGSGSQPAETETGGRALIYVWALEQKDSRRGWDEGHEQDVMVPWVMKSNNKANHKNRQKNKAEHREHSDHLSASVSGMHTQDGPSKACSDSQHSVKEKQDTSCAAHDNDSQQATSDSQESKTFQRYYHLYRKGELEHDIAEAGGIVLDSGYEKDNWWAVATPVVGTSAPASTNLYRTS